MVRVTRSTVIDAPPEAVWRVLRDFNSHRDWHPAIAESVIEGGRRGDQVGCVRRFRLRDGGELREQLLALSDLDRRLVYCILDAPLPLYGYVAQLRLKRITDTGGTFWEWQSDFETPEGREAELAGIVGGDIYEAGFEALRRRLTGPTTIPVSRPPAQTGPRAQNAAAPVRSSASDAGETIESGAMVLQRYGPAEALQWGSIRVPPPGSGEVRIRHTAVGLNYIDVYCRTGYFDLARPPTPLGLEAAGVVTAVGKDVQHLRVGQRVAYACIPVGAYTEQRTMDASLVVPLPDEIDDETAAAATLKGMTAEFLLHRVHRVTEGETVVVHAAAGGVGSLLCQWARQLGAAVIGTVGTEGKLQQAR
ncbi:MAG: SRPBCC family protein, partial [Ectothiorhodospiraceae bacterium]